MTEEQDEYWMRHCISLAEKAAALQEVPVGAVLIKDNELIAEGWNQPIGSHDPTAHAEIVALRRAAEQLGNYRMPATTLYVTIEPCAMCAGALIHARVGRLVYGASEPKAGAIDSTIRLLDQAHLNHRVEYHGGVLADECGAQLSRFFKARRAEG